MPKQDQDEVPRRRGRPSGKNRVPLSVEERRARNAQYERERRNDYAEAMLELATAAGCENTISNPELLATVINKIQKAAEQNSSKDINELKRINENLESQIASLTERLENEPDSNEMPPAKRYKLSETSELRTDSEPQTSSCFYNPADRAATASSKRIKKIKKGKLRKLRKQSTARNNQPHTSNENLSATWSDTVSSTTSNERSESESPEPQTSHTEMWTEESSNSVFTTDSEQYSCAQELDNRAVSLNEFQIESNTSDVRIHSTFYTQTELHELSYQYEQINQLEPIAMQRTQYDPPPDAAPIVESQSDIYFQSDYQNIPDIQHAPGLESITDLFTDNEKHLLDELINCSSDLFRNENYNSGIPVRQWSIDDLLTLQL